MTDADNPPSTEPQRLEAHLAVGRGRHSYLRPATVVAIVIFATGAMLGVFVTVFWLPEPDTWWLPLSVRVGWQLGGAVLLALAIAFEAGSLRAVLRAWPVVLGGLVIAALFGTVFCVNPLLDLVRGPATATGRLSLRIEREASRYSHDATTTTFTIRTADGERLESEVWGQNEQEVVTTLKVCDQGAPVTITVLRHMETVLALSCTRQPGR